MEGCSWPTCKEEKWTIIVNLPYVIKIEGGKLEESNSKLVPVRFCDYHSKIAKSMKFVALATDADGEFFKLYGDFKLAEMLESFIEAYIQRREYQQYKELLRIKNLAKTQP